MKKANSNLKNSFEEDFLENEISDDLFSKYFNRVLDVFDHQLSEDEATHKLSSFEKHNLENEVKFIELFKRLFLLNDGRIILKFELKSIEPRMLFNIIVDLDYQDRVSFCESIINHFDSKSTLYSDMSAEKLLMFVRLATRELYFPVFYLKKYPAMIIGNFDLSFPIFMLNSDDYTLYEKIARECDLFLRE